MNTKPTDPPEKSAQRNRHPLATAAGGTSLRKNRPGLALAASAAMLAAAAAAPASTRLDWRAGGGFLDAGPVGEYYANASLSGTAAFARRDVRIDFDWGSALKPGGSISTAFRGVGNDNYSVRWAGRLAARFAETYTFKVVCDDGARLYIKPTGNGTWTTLLDKWTVSGTHTATYAMGAGAKYDLKLEYKELTGAAKIRLLWSSPSTPEEVIEAATSLGMGAPAGEMMFANTFIGGSNHAENYPAGSTDPKKDGVLARDTAGWPSEDFSFMVRPNDSRQLAGTYLLKFNGRADVSTTVGAGVFKSAGGTGDFGNTLDASTGTEGYITGTTTALFVVPANTTGVTFKFAKTDRDGNFGTDAIPDNDGLTAIEVLKPGAPFSSAPHPAGTLFDQNTKNLWKRFTVTRWNDSNSASLDDPNDHTTSPCFPGWANRAKYASGGSGVNHERKILWCNENGCDLWIQIPHHVVGSDADNTEYIRKLARLIRYGSDANGNPYTAFQTNPVYPGLNPNLKVYLEYSNEVPWNGAGQYPQAGWILATADWEVANHTATGQIITFDGPATENQQRGRRYIAIRVREISNLFREVWGDASMPGTAADPRVRPLLMGQYDNANIPRDTLYFLDRYFNNADGINHVATPHPVDHYLWTYGAASYYGCDNPEGTIAGFTWNNASAEAPVLAAGHAAIAPTNFAGWAFTGKAGVYRNAARSLVSGPSYTVGGQDVAIYDFYGAPNTDAYVYDAATGTQLMKRPLEAGGYRQAGQYVAFTLEDKYFPLILEAGKSYNFANTSQVSVAATGVGGSSGTNSVNFGFTYDASEGNQVIFLAGTSSATIDLPLPQAGTYAITYDLAQIRDPDDYDGDGSAYPDTLNNPLDIFLVVGGVETRITPRSRDDIQAGSGPSAHGDFGRHVDSFQKWGSAPFQSSGSVKIRFKGTHANSRYAVFLDNLRLASAKAIADSNMPTSGSATGEQGTSDWLASKAHQWTYAQAYGLHPGMYEGGWYPGGDWDKLPIQLYFSMKDPGAKAVEKLVQDHYAKVGVHVQTDFTLGLAIPTYDYQNPGGYARLQAWDEILSALPAAEDNGYPLGEIYPDESPWYSDADTVGEISRNGGFYSWNVIIPRYGNYYVQAVTDRGAAYRVYLDGSEVCVTGTAASASAAGMIQNLAKGLHNLRLQSRDAAPFSVCGLSIQRASSAVPTVNAGVDQTLSWPDATANLSGTVTDADSRPTVRWELYDGPVGGLGVFGNANALNTTARFDRPGNYTLALTAVDGAVVVRDFLKITVLPSAANLVPNGSFGQAFVTVTDPWLASATHADVGWVVTTTQTKWTRSPDGYATVASRGGFGAVSQIIDVTGLAGTQFLSLRAKNTVAGGTTWIKVWGCHGAMSINATGEGGPAGGTLLYNKDIGGSAYDWTTFSDTLNVGVAGYDYLAIKVYSTGGSGFTAIDDVSVTPSDNLVIHGDFGGDFVEAGSWINSDTHADVGWVAMSDQAKWARSTEGYASVASRGGFGAISQILDASGLTGACPFSMRAKNSVAGGTTWLKVWGVQGWLQVNTSGDAGPKNRANQEIGTLLYTKDIGASAYDWTLFTGTLNLGATGYDYLVIKVYSSGGSGVTAVDDVWIEMPVGDLVVNGDFSQAFVTTPVAWINSDTHADVGWVAMSDQTKWTRSPDGYASVASRGGFGAISQIIDAGGLTGAWSFSMRAKNSAAGGTTWLKVWGVRGPFNLQATDATGPKNSAYQEIGGTPLYTKDIGASVYDWSTLTGPVNLGTGYDYLVIKAYSTGGSGVTAFDDVTIE